MYVVIVAIVSIVGYFLYSNVRSNCRSAKQFTNLLHDHVINRSVAAAECGNPLSSLINIGQAQASLDILSHVSGGDDPLGAMCTDDIQVYRSSLHEQYTYYLCQVQQKCFTTP